MKKARRARRLMYLMIGGLLLAIGVGGFFAFKLISVTEAEQYEKAMETYKEQRYPEAAKKFNDLAKKFKDSSDKPKYEFLAALSNLRASMGVEDLDILGALDKLGEFLEADAKSTSTFLKDFAIDIGESLFKRV